MLCEHGVDLEDPEVAEEVSTCVHDELYGFYSRENAIAKGVPVQRRIHSFRPKSELSIDERKRNVEKAKANSHCRTCGRKAHWAGDPACPARNSGKSDTKDDQNKQTA